MVRVLVMGLVLSTASLVWAEGTDTAGAKAADPAATPKAETQPVGQADNTLERVAVTAGDTLNGPLPRIVLASKSPYLVLSDILVPQGQTVIVEPGVVFLFSGFTGLKVQGTLLARGSNEKPIVFTSVNDAVYNPASKLQPAPYDWNGIQISEDGLGTHFSYSVISYSVFGIVSMTRYMRIGPTLFQENGRANLTIEGLEHEVGTEPYEYNATAAVPETTPDSLTVLPDPLAQRRTIVRYSGLGVAFVGAIMATVYTVKFSNSDDDLEGLSSTDPYNLASGDAAAWNAASDRAHRDRAGMVWGYVIGVVGAAGFGWSFFF